MTAKKTRAELNFEARVDLATAYRACNYYDMDDGIFNHITQRAPAKDGEGDVMLVVPHGLLWNQVTASCLIGVDFDTGEVVEGNGNVAVTANAIHRAIHKIRYPIDGMTSIMHTHQPYSTTLACIDDPEPLKFGLSQTAMYFYGKVAYDYDYTGYAFAEEEGYRLAKALSDDKEVLMMGHHGVMTVGKRACDAFMYLHQLEKAAKIQILAQSSGMKMRIAPQEVIERVAESGAKFDADVLLNFQALTAEMSNRKPCVTD